MRDLGAKKKYLNFNEILFLRLHPIRAGGDSIIYLFWQKFVEDGPVENDFPFVLLQYVVCTVVVLGQKYSNTIFRFLV
jgi:hypothetical protein